MYSYLHESDCYTCSTTDVRIPILQSFYIHDECFISQRDLDSQYSNETHCKSAKAIVNGMCYVKTCLTSVPQHCYWILSHLKECSGIYSFVNSSNHLHGYKNFDSKDEEHQQNSCLKLWKVPAELAISALSVMSSSAMMRRQSAGGILSRKVSIVLITMSVLPERNRLPTHTEEQKEIHIKQECIPVGCVPAALDRDPPLPAQRPPR